MSRKLISKMLSGKVVYSDKASISGGCGRCGRCGGFSDVEVKLRSIRLGSFRLAFDPKFIV